jgi:hypothetical protein
MDIVNVHTELLVETIDYNILFTHSNKTLNMLCLDNSQGS